MKRAGVSSSRYRFRNISLVISGGGVGWRRGEEQGENKCYSDNTSFLYSADVIAFIFSPIGLAFKRIKTCYRNIAASSS